MEKDYFIKKWLSGELSAEELKSFQKLEDFEFLQSIVADARSFKASEFSEMEEFDTFSKRLKPVSKPNERHSWIKTGLRIASMLAVAVGLYYFFLADSRLEVSTMAGEKTTISLPDASVVTLNAGSSLKYSEKTWEGDRRVLLEGEAFFKVKKGSKFSVDTKGGSVTVLGTEFNVKHRHQYFGVDCFEGRVLVKLGGLEEELVTGTYIRKSKNELSRGVTQLKSPAWTDNKSLFELVPFSEVLSEFERQYRVKIELSGLEEDPLFTGGFPHDNLDHALQVITKPFNLRYSKENPEQIKLFVSE